MKECDFDIQFVFPFWFQGERDDLRVTFFFFKRYSELVTSSVDMSTQFKPRFGVGYLTIEYLGRISSEKLAK